MMDTQQRIENLIKDYTEVQNYISRNNRPDSLEEIAKVNTMLDQQEMRKNTINKLRLSIGLGPLERITPEAIAFQELVKGGAA